MLLDEDRPLATRRRAANALHDVATSDLLEPLRQAMGDLLLEPWVETEVGLLLARLGDRQTLDRWIRQLRRVTDRIPTTVTLAEILEGLGRLGDLQFRSEALGAATATHRRRIALMTDLIPRVPERLQKPLNDEMQAIHYNLACCLALTGKIDAAFEATEQSLRSSTIRITMVQVDGDLRALREDARWSDWLSKQIEDKVPASQTPEAEEQRR
jgi:HEAT repeat protein